MSSTTGVLSSSESSPWILKLHQGLFFLYLVSLLSSMSGMEIFSTLCGLFTLLTWRVPERNGLLWKPVVAFVAVVVVSVLLGEASLDQKLYDLSRLRFFILYALLFLQLRNWVGVSQWERVLLWVGLLMGVYGVFQHFMPLDLVRPEGKKIFRYAIQSEEIGPLVIGTFNHHLTFSNIFILHGLFLLALGWNRNPRSWSFMGVGALLLLCCIWTQSRIGWVAVPASLLVLGWSHGRKWVLGLCGFAVVFFGLCYLLDSGFQQRLDRTFFQQDQLYNAGPRQRLWSVQWQMFRSSPWLGLGWNNNERFSKEWVDRAYPEQPENFYGHAHSMPLQILASTGLLGFIAFYWLWFAVFSQCWRLIRCSRKGSTAWAVGWGLMAAFIGFHIQGLTQWNFGDAEVLHSVIFYWAVLAYFDSQRLPHPAPL